MWFDLEDTGVGFPSGSVRRPRNLFFTLQGHIFHVLSGEMGDKFQAEFSLKIYKVNQIKD